METKDLAKRDWEAGMKYAAIAEKHGVPLSTVKSWAARYWKSKTVATGRKKVASEKTQPSKRQTTAPTIDQRLAAAVEENSELTPQQKDFCLYYSRTRNATQAYLRAYGCSYSTAQANAWRLLEKQEVQAKLRRLREIKAAHLSEICGADIVDLRARIALADMTDFVKFGAAGVVSVRDSEQVDGQLINEISEGPNGIKIKLANRDKSLEFMEQYLKLDGTERDESASEKRARDVLTLADILRNPAPNRGLPTDEHDRAIHEESD